MPLLLHLGHAQIPLGLVIGERDGQIVEEGEHAVAVPEQGIQQVLGGGLLGASAPSRGVGGAADGAGGALAAKPRASRAWYCAIQALRSSASRRLPPSRAIRWPPHASRAAPRPTPRPRPSHPARPPASVRAADAPHTGCGCRRDRRCSWPSGHASRAHGSAAICQSPRWPPGHAWHARPDV